MNIKVNLFLVTLCLSIFYVCAEDATETDVSYTTKYDSINLDDLLKNDRLRRNYVNCLLNEGPCTPDALELKNSLPDAIATDCSKCSAKQRDGSLTVTHYLIDNHPDEWERLEKIYDKSGDYKKRYLASKSSQNDEENPTTIEPKDEK